MNVILFFHINAASLNAKHKTLFLSLSPSLLLRCKQPPLAQTIPPPPNVNNNSQAIVAPGSVNKWMRRSDLCYAHTHLHAPTHTHTRTHSHTYTHAFAISGNWSIYVSNSYYNLCRGINWCICRERKLLYDTLLLN